MNLELFSINATRPYITRLNLSALIQKEVTECFRAQAADFVTRHPNPVAFEAGYKLEEDEKFVIGQYDDIIGMFNAVAAPLSIPVISPSADALDNIKGLFVGDDIGGHITIFIQRFEKRRILARNGLTMVFSNGCYEKLSGDGLSLDTKIMARLRGTELEFTSFHFARRVLDLDGYLAAATNDDILNFCNQGPIYCDSPDQVIDISDNLVRTKIALVMRDRVWDVVPINELKAKAEAFGISLTIALHNGSDSIIIPTQRSELKRLLKFLDEDYYESSLTGRKFVSNSKAPVQLQP